MRIDTWVNLVLSRVHNSNSHHVHKIKRAGMDMTANAAAMLNRAYEADPGVYRLAKLPLTFFELRPTDGRDVLVKRAAEVNLQPCPARLAPTVRPMYPHQPRKEILWAGMNFIIGIDGQPYGFCLTCDERDNMHLGAYLGGKHLIDHDKIHVIFVIEVAPLPRKYVLHRSHVKRDLPGAGQ